MIDYRLKDKVFEFCIFKNTDSSYFKIREILKKGSIAGNENGIRLITPILECLRCVDQEKVYTYKKIGKKNWPCRHWLSLSCKYILDYSKDDEGLDKYLYHRFNLRNFKEDDICQPNNELF